jgi:hypothetical protein
MTSFFLQTISGPMLFVERQIIDIRSNLIEQIGGCSQIEV